MKIAICGDSWFSLDANHSGKSFSEIIAKNNNWELLNLARSGCSNFAIALQIDHAIQTQSDFVVVRATTCDRIELPIIKQSVWEKFKNNFNRDSWHLAQPGVYQKERGLANIYYKKVAFLENPTIISESINNLLFWTTHNKMLSSEQKESLKMYALNLYDFKIKWQIDSWCISDACRRLTASNIPFLIYTESLYKGAEGFFEDISWVPEKNRIDYDQFSFHELPIHNTEFHYSISDSEKIVNYLQSRIQPFLN